MRPASNTRTYSWDRRAARPILDDLLAPGLALVFCGTAAGRVSAARGAYYAHPQNKFWTTLHAIGLTPRRLDPSEFPLLIDWRIGLTDIAKHAFGMDAELPPASLGRAACEDLRARIALHKPAVLAFTSLTGARRFLGRETRPGAQKETIGATRIWALPSPSPAAHWAWSEAPWRALAETVLPQMTP
jgi:TDG/mug DNA glycosylase family protein